MAKLEAFVAALPERKSVEVYVVELADGRIVSRTREELEHAPDDVRIAAGLEPRETL